MIPFIKNKKVKCTHYIFIGLIIKTARYNVKKKAKNYSKTQKSN